MNKSKIFLIICSVIPIVMLLFILPQANDTIAVHFNASLEADRYGSKYYLIIPSLFPLLMALFFIYYEKKTTKNQKLINIFSFVIVLFMVVIDIWIYLITFSKGYSSTTILFIAFAVLFIIFGNYSNKIQYNHFLGIRTPATLKSKVVWDKTHRLGGYIFFSIGLSLLLLSVILYNYQTLLLYIFIIMVLSSVTYLAVYAHIELKKQEQL